MQKNSVFSSFPGTESGFQQIFHRQMAEEKPLRLRKAPYDATKFPWPNPKESLSFNLRGLPTEVRIVIFEIEIKRWKWGRRTPPIVQALRPDSVMYFEALEIYYEVMSFAIITRNQNHIKWMPDSVKERVKILEIWYG